MVNLRWLTPLLFGVIMLAFYVLGIYNGWFIIPCVGMMILMCILFSEKVDFLEWEFWDKLELYVEKKLNS